MQIVTGSLNTKKYFERAFDPEGEMKNEMSADVLY